MALRTIREFGDEVLNKECKEVNIGVPPEPSEEDWREKAGR